MSWEDRADAAWEPAELQSGALEVLGPLHRALPAGEYALVGYRLIQKDVGVDLWYASATGESIAVIAVAAGAAVRPELDPAVTIELARAELADGALQLGMSVTGAGGAGLTLYKNSKRIPIAYSVTTKKRKELVRANMTYG